MRKSALPVLLGIALIGNHAWPASQKKKEKEEVTQQLEIPREPPSVLTADTSRLVFRVSPLSSRGLLSQQARGALKWLMRQNRKAAIVKLRAFVAGSGDIRRVQTVVSEMFTDKRLPLPVLTVVQVGALPHNGAQVVIESVAVSRKPVNPHGLAFISGQAAFAEKPTLEMAPLAGRSVGNLVKAVHAAGAESKDVLRATCFMSSLQDVNAVRRRLTAEFPQAALNYVQIQRSPMQSLVECEAVARLRSPLDEPLRLLNPAGLPNSSNYSQIALVGAPKVVLSGAQLAFRFQEDDARLAFQRLEKDLGTVGASLRHVAMSSVYPLSNSIGGLVGKVRFEFYDKQKPPASTMLPFEDLPALDASFAVDVIAVMPDSL